MPRPGERETIVDRYCREHGWSAYRYREGYIPTRGVDPYDDLELRHATEVDGPEPPMLRIEYIEYPESGMGFTLTFGEAQILDELLQLYSEDE